MEVAKRLREARAAAGYATASDAARAFGWSEPTYFAHENGSRGLRPDVARRYARAFRVSSAWLLYGEQTAEAVEPIPLTRLIPVVGEVRAGAWAEVLDDTVHDEVSVNLPQYDRASLFGLTVAGRSMDLHYPEGTVVIVCPTAEAGVRVGDHVIVRRARSNLYETTIKEVQVGPGGILELWPRSTDPAHQVPLTYQPARDENTQEGVAIIGVVVASYRSRRSEGPLLDL